MADLVWDILREYGETDPDNVWKVQGATVIKHACLERVASRAGIEFSAPSILRAEADEAVILVTGRLEARTEWSIGEARTVAMVDTGRKNSYNKPIYEPADGAIGNYQVTPKQAAYPFAMAEKRGKDRVILKLIKLHGLAYSEEEADEFRTAPRETAAPSEKTEGAFDVAAVSQQVRDAFMSECIKKIAAFTSEKDLLGWWNGDARKKAFKDMDLTGPESEKLKAGVLARREMLKADAPKEAA